MFPPCKDILRRYYIAVEATHRGYGSLIGTRVIIGSDNGDSATRVYLHETLRITCLIFGVHVTSRVLRGAGRKAWPNRKETYP